MMNNIEQAYSEFADELTGNQKRYAVNSVLGVYYGMSNDGYLRISFMSVLSAPKMESTKLLRVTQGSEGRDVFWTCFDLLQSDARKVFFTFCENLIEAITDIDDERIAVRILEKRYVTWKTMFKHDYSRKVSREVLQGLYGELYFLKNYMIEKYGINDSVISWSGPDDRSKDFSINRDWYEIKTVGANSSSVNISSLSQLSSDYDGHLVILRSERMSDGFDNGEACINDLFKYIISMIDSEIVESVFFSKLSAYGYDISDDSFTAKFDIKAMQRYRVSDGFPRLTERDIQKNEICDVSYSLIINSLKQYMEE